MRETETHIFFWSGYCSQWEPSKFVIEGVEYNCAEQYMMAEKAKLFDDDHALSVIMLSNDPATQKFAGRTVKNFDPQKWNEICRLVVYRGNLAKFTQNKKMLAWLLNTENKVIVEASPKDQIWGIGLHYSDPLCDDPKNWRGKNWLGEAIMQVRSDIVQLGKLV